MTSDRQVIKQIPWVKVDDHSIISEPVTSSLILLNPSATIIWQSYRCGQSLSGITQTLAARFHISATQAGCDIENIIKQWRDLGLMENSKCANKPGRWQKQSQLENTQRPDHKPLFQQTYQLNSQKFKILYYHDDNFDTLHNVLSHMQISDVPVSDQSPELICYEIFYDNNYLLFESGKFKRKFENLDQLVEGLQWTLIENAYQNRDWLTVLHSAALGNKDGYATVFIARRGSGKSTLARFLQTQGFIYLADDVVPVTLAGDISPMPMCQRFKQGSWELLGINDSVKHKIFARHEGHYVKYAQPLTGSSEDWKRNWPVQTIIFPSYSSASTACQLVPLTKIDSLTRLCRSGSVFGGNMDQLQLEALTGWISSVPSYSLEYAEFSPGLCDQIRELLT